MNTEMSSFDARTSVGTKQSAQKRDLEGVVLDGIYKLKSRLNAGAMGEIWVAEQVQLGTEWLVKLLPTKYSEDPAYIAALTREAKVTAGLPGNYFPAVVYTGNSEGVAFYVMEYLKGKDLLQFIETEWPTGMDAEDGLPIVDQILEAMSIAHEAGVVHRDIKPSNIFIEDIDSDTPKVRILDFGIAETSDDTHDTERLPAGTGQYMPPERHTPIPAEATRAGDVYAFGLIAYFIFTGKSPLDGVDYVRQYAEGTELRPLHESKEGEMAGINSEVGTVFTTAVRLNPQERFSSAGEMLKALRHAVRFKPSNISRGTILGGSYKVIGPIGAGGMGSVYEVEDIYHSKSIDMRQALKILAVRDDLPESAKDLMRERFRRECGLLRQLEHESIPHIFGNDRHLGHPYMVMELVSGWTFGKGFSLLLKRGGWSAVFAMARQLASALDAAHGLGIIHRDIKPSNLMIDPDTGHAKVLDFGVAKVEDTQLTVEGMQIGTYGWIAAEQFRCHPCTASDQWSLAACFYAVLSGLLPGQKPGESSDVDDFAWEISKRVSKDQLVALGDVTHHVEVPTSVVIAIEKALSFLPEQRFESVGAFVDAMASGLTQPDAPIVVDIPTEAALQKWTQKSTVLLLDTTKVEEQKIGDDATPILLTPSTSSTQNTVTGKQAIPRWLAATVGLAAIPILAMLLFTGSSEPDGKSAMRQDEPELSGVAADTATVDAGHRTDSREVAPPPATVAATLDGRPIEDLIATIDGKNVVLPYSGTLEGRVAVKVGNPLYRKDYYCDVSDEGVCRIELTLVPKKKPVKRRRPRDEQLLDIYDFSKKEVE